MDPHWLTPAALARCCLMVAVAAWCSRPVAPAGAADTHNMKVTVAGIQVGGHVSGPQLTDQSLAHRVVVLEFWGVNCPPCIASMPKLAELHRQYGPSGLVIVGAHAQGGAAAEVKKVVDGLGVTFSIVDSAQVADGMDFFYQNKSHALKMLDFISSVLPVRNRGASEKLISADTKSATANVQMTCAQPPARTNPHTNNSPHTACVTHAADTTLSLRPCARMISFASPARRRLQWATSGHWCFACRCVTAAAAVAILGFCMCVLFPMKIGPRPCR